METGNFTARELARQSPDTECALKFVLCQDPFHIGVPRHDPDLLQWVNTFVDCHKLVGAFNELSKRWIGEELPELQEAP